MLFSTADACMRNDKGSLQKDRGTHAPGKDRAELGRSRVSVAVRVKKLKSGAIVESPCLISATLADGHVPI